jgi:hypothetical protein
MRRREVKMNKHMSLVVAIAVTLGGCGKSEEQKKKDAQEAAAQAFVEAFGKLGEVSEQAEKVEEDKLSKRTLKLGSSIRLGSLELSPASVELRKVGVKPLFGEELEQKGPFLVLTVRAKNVSEGQVFNPFMTADVKDNFGNELDDALGLTEIGMIDGSEILKEIGPGETGTVLICKAVKIPKATSYQWDLSSQVDNKDTYEQWRCTTTVSEIKVVDSSK